MANRRLQQRGGDLIDQGDDADLGEAEMKIGLERRIDGRQQGLHHVVQQMTEADREQHREGGVVDGLAGGDGVGHGAGKMPCGTGFGHPPKRRTAFQGSGGRGVHRTSSILRRTGRQHHQPVETQRHPCSRRHMGQGGQELLIQRIAFAMDALLFVHLRLKAGALFHRIGEFAKAVRQLHATGIKLEPFRQARIGGLRPGQRRFLARVVGEKREPLQPQPGLDGGREHLGEDVRPAITRRRWKSPRAWPAWPAGRGRPGPVRPTYPEARCRHGCGRRRQPSRRSASAKGSQIRSR